LELTTMNNLELYYVQQIREVYPTVKLLKQIF